MESNWNQVKLSSYAVEGQIGLFCLQNNTLEKHVS